MRFPKDGMRSGERIAAGFCTVPLNRNVLKTNIFEEI
jgi:hypothetical protein